MGFSDPPTVTSGVNWKMEEVLFVDPGVLGGNDPPCVGNAGIPAGHGPVPITPDGMPGEGPPVADELIFTRGAHDVSGSFCGFELERLPVLGVLRARHPARATRLPPACLKRMTSMTQTEGGGSVRENKRTVGQGEGEREGDGSDDGQSTVYVIATGG